MNPKTFISSSCYMLIWTCLLSVSFISSPCLALGIQADDATPVDNIARCIATGNENIVEAGWEVTQVILLFIEKHGHVVMPNFNTSECVFHLQWGILDMGEKWHLHHHSQASKNHIRNKSYGRPGQPGAPE